MSSYLLSLALFSPLLGVLLALPVPRERIAYHRLVGVVFILLSSLAVFAAAASFNLGAKGMQLVENLPWIPALGVRFHLGVDGLSLPLLVMTTLVSLLVVLSSWNWRTRVKEYFILILLLQTGMLGVFVSLDLFLFFFCFELTLIPMYFLIGIWGGARKDYAAVKFILYTGLGSAIMFIAFLALRLSGGTFSFTRLAAVAAGFPPAFQWAVFLALFLAFAIKTPIVPFHTWLPDAHVEAPTQASMLLAGVLLKMGTYGILRLNFTLFPAVAHAFAPVLAVFAVVNVLYGAFLAMAQRDLKKMVAYASISSMGYVLLGAAAGTNIALDGAVLQMFTHGLVSAFMFFAVGIIYERAHTRQIPELGGLAGRMPLWAWSTLIGALCYLGLPGLGIFASEFTVFLGSYAVLPWATILAGAGIVLTAGYLLYMGERVLFGPLRPTLAGLPDARGWVEILPMVSLIGLMLAVGIFPASLGQFINPAMGHLAQLLKGGAIS